MPLSRERKEAMVEEYADLLERSNAVIFTEYRGLSNPEMTRLRRAVRDAEGVYQVAKLTLFQLALERIGYPVPEDMLTGKPIAVGFCLNEVPGVAKAIVDFAEDESEELVLHGGMLGQDFMTAQQIEALAELPPLDTLRAQLLGLLDASASQLVGVIQSGVSQIVNVLNAYAQQEEGGEPAEAAAAG